MKKHIFPLCFLLATISCQSEPKQASDPTPTDPIVSHPSYCPNQLALIAADSARPIVPLDFEASYAQQRQSVFDAFWGDTCMGVYHFAILFDTELPENKPTPHSIHLPVIFEHLCPSSMIICGITPKKFQILINANHQMLLDGYLGAPDTIALMVEDWYDWEYHWRSYILVEWDEKAVPTKLISEAIAAAIKGYLKAMDKLAQEEHGKSICDLTNKEIQAYKRQKHTRFHLLLTLGNWLYAPPVPNPSVYATPVIEDFPEEVLEPEL